MTGLHRYSEPYPPSGTISAEGARNTLGRPKLALPELLLREALQNSCDAAETELDSPLRFCIDDRILTRAQRDTLRTALGDTPADGLDLEDSLGRETVRALLIADRGTTGLGGPTRADMPSEPGSPRDFVDLLRNIGQPSDKEFGSGTYGYGKSVLFRASTPSTIIVHTRCRLPNGHHQSRLLATALGRDHEENGRLMTGRHWWGRHDPDVGAEPLLDDDADSLAADLGLEPIDGTGTTIMIVDPALDDPSETARRFADAALLYAWPRLAGIDGIPQLDLTVAVDGTPVDIADPGDDPHLAGFVTALHRLRSGDSETLRCLSPKQDLGEFTFETVSPWPEPVPTVDGTDDDFNPREVFAGGLHHSALMRHAHLVIAYRPGPPHHIPGVAWAAVFVARDEVDRAFADAEPPSHDEWNHQLLPPRSRERKFVNMAKRRIDETVDRLTTPRRNGDGDDGPTGPLGRLADSLSDLVATVESTRTGGRGEGGGGRNGRPRARVHIESVRHTSTPAGPVLLIDFTVTHRPGTEQTVVDASVSWAVDDGDRDTEGPSPTGWTSPEGAAHPPGPVTIIDDGTWCLTVPQGQELGLVVDISPAEATP